MSDGLIEPSTLSVIQCSSITYWVLIFLWGCIYRNSRKHCVAASCLFCMLHGAAVGARRNISCVVVHAWVSDGLGAWRWLLHACAFRCYSKDVTMPSDIFTILFWLFKSINKTWIILLFSLLIYILYWLISGFSKPQRGAKSLPNPCQMCTPNSPKVLLYCWH